MITTLNIRNQRYRFMPRIHKTTQSQGRFRRIVLRDGYKCAICHVVNPFLTIDHIIKKADGGSNKDENLRLLCLKCHRKKDSIQSMYTHVLNQF